MTIEANFKSEHAEHVPSQTQLGSEENNINPPKGNYTFLRISRRQWTNPTDK